MVLKSIGFILAALAVMALACSLTAGGAPRSERDAPEAQAPATNENAGENGDPAAGEDAAGGSAAGDPAEGERLFQRMGCSGCHNGPANLAPTLDGVYGAQVSLESGETVTADEAYLRRSILDSQAQIVRGYQPIMPEYGSQLSAEQVAALVAYIRSLGD